MSEGWRNCQRVVRGYPIGARGARGQSSQKCSAAALILCYCLCMNLAPSPVPRADVPETPTTVEEWRPIPGYGGQYEASNHGRLRSMMTHGHARCGGPQLLKPSCASRYGHLRVTWVRDGRERCIPVARLVLLAFVGAPPSDKHQAAHLNGCPSDNRVENLAWVTVKENQHHRRVHGTDPTGERAPRAKLSNAEVDTLRSLAATMTTRDLAARFGISMGHVRKIVTGRYMKRVTTAAVAAPKHDPTIRHSDDVVRAVRADAARGDRVSHIAKRYGMSNAQAGRIIRNELRRDVA